MNNTPDEYYTLAKTDEYRVKVKGSVFFAIASPVDDREDAENLLQKWRKTYYDSTHIGWAYRLAPPPGGEIRYDDDGEPHGTTGMPIFKSIEGADLWGVLVGVVRWYGGTKLGTGGLARAYGGAATEAIKLIKRKKIEIRSTLRIKINSDLIGIVYSLADKSGAKLDAPEYIGDGIGIDAHVLLSKVKSFSEDIRESTAGEAVIEILA